MCEYSVVFARSARKELEGLPETIRRRVEGRIEQLASKPRPAGVRKLVGSEDLWRLRIGDYRVIYAVHDERKLVDIICIRHRKDAYR
jgi:mRNA interferase RelE/StbE